MATHDGEKTMVDSPHKRPAVSFDVFFVGGLKKLLNELPVILYAMKLMWRHCTCYNEVMRTYRDIQLMYIYFVNITITSFYPDESEHKGHLLLPIDLYTKGELSSQFDRGTWRYGQYMDHNFEWNDFSCQFNTPPTINIFSLTRY